MKENKIIRTEGGRPRAIDDIGVESLLEKLRKEPNMADEELRPLIRMEHQKSCLRQHPESVESQSGEGGRKKKRKKFKKINYVSVVRYCEELRAKVGAKASSRSKSQTSVSSQSSSAPASIPVNGESAPPSKKSRN